MFADPSLNYLLENVTRLILRLTIVNCAYTSSWPAIAGVTASGNEAPCLFCGRPPAIAGFSRLGASCWYTAHRITPLSLPQPVTDKWGRARYVATREEIASGNAEWEIIGAPDPRRRSARAWYSRRLV